MHIEIILTQNPIARPQAWTVPHSLETGSLVEFYGIVRETEGAAKIPALHYEAYASWPKNHAREDRHPAGQAPLPGHPASSIASARSPPAKAPSTSASNPSTAGRASSSSRNSWTNSKKTSPSGKQPERPPPSVVAAAVPSGGCPPTALVPKLLHARVFGNALVPPILKNPKNPFFFKRSRLFRISRATTPHFFHDMIIP